MRWRVAAAAEVGGSRLEGVALGRLRVATWGPKLAEGVQGALPQPGKVADLALDARHLFVGSRDGTLGWYDASTGEERQPVRLT